MQSVQNRRGMAAVDVVCVAVIVVLLVLVTAVIAASPAMPAAGPGSVTDFKRATASNSSQNGFTLASGVTLRATVEATGCELHSLGGRGAVRGRGLRVLFFGTGDNNDVMSFKVWMYRDIGPRGSANTATGLVASLYGYGTATLGTAAGNASTEVSASEVFADTITWTVANTGSTYHGTGEMLEAAYGQFSATYSPADNTIAELVIPDLGNTGYWLIEFDRAADANLAMNALVSEEN